MQLQQRLQDAEDIAQARGRRVMLCGLTALVASVALGSFWGIRGQAQRHKRSQRASSVLRDLILGDQILELAPWGGGASGALGSFWGIWFWGIQRHKGEGTKATST